ncbi:MAG: type VI secretion system Vgr family protein [Stenotrophomonas sp.]|uniref:type VI secretion system Vgr family protein n=1 Tax=Stenotrophomonas sp. TaxID=69392 RepID=UPI003D6C7CA0
MSDKTKSTFSAPVSGASSGFVAKPSSGVELTPSMALNAADAVMGAVDNKTVAKAQKVLSAAKSAAELLQTSQNIDVGGLMAKGAELVGLASPEAAQVTGAASQVASLAQTFSAVPNLAASATPPFVPGSLRPDVHPLGGQAIGDFIQSPEFYAPPLIRPQDLDSSAAGVLDDRNRLLRLHAPLGDDKRLYIAALEGNAALSNPYHYRLQLLSRNADIDLQEVMGKSFTVGIRLADGSEHPINGYITAFGFSRTDGGLAMYTAEMTPWLWYLQTRITSRIFQDMSVLDVLDKVFKDYGGLPDYQLRISKRPAPETYIVQYDESDLNFVSRLLERHGLFYYFEHRDDGHSLIISDDSPDSSCCPAQQAHAVVRYNAGDRVDAQDTLTALSAHRSFQPSAVALNTFKYKDPYAIQYVEQPTLAEQGDVPKLTVYHGNPAFTHKDQKAGRHDAQLLMEAYEWQAKLFVAQSECRGIQAGHTFVLTGHHWFESDADADFLVVGTQIDARNNFNLGDDVTEGSGDVYSNTLTLIRRKIPYRPVRHHAKPIMKGPQTATVVGTAGQEIHTDKYGRIKVQFPWDLEGRHNESSSCWIRVSQPWAGRGWGTVAIPRIGQEVLIDYIEGDPDRPVSTGRLFNAQQKMPFDGPEAANVMGFISNSTPGGGGQCRMTIRDTAGQELIDLFSQKDMNVTTLNNMATVVKGPEQTNVVSHGLQTNTVQKSIEITSVDESITVKAKTEIKLTSQAANIAAKAKAAVTLESETEHVTITGKTLVRLVAGKSSLELQADGTILLNGKIVQIVGTSSVDLNP